MKSKLSALLDETTILNFKFIAKLMRRYKLIGCIIPVLVAGMSLYMYKTQNEIYSGSISFRYLPESKSSPVTALSALMPDQERSLDSTEILGIINSTNFLQTLAFDVQKDEKLASLNLNPLFVKEKKSYKELVGTCGGRVECEVNYLRQNLPSFFTITEDDIVLNKYNVMAKTLSRETTDKIIRYVSKNVGKYRLDTINFQLQGQVELTEKLILQQEDKLSNFNVSQIAEERKLLEIELETLTKKSSLYNAMVNEKKIALEQEEISLKYTKTTLNRKVSNKDKKEWKKLENLILRKELLIADITALEHSLGNKSKQDNAVIVQLKNELKKINTEVGKFESSKSFSTLEKFKDEKLKNKDVTEFNIKVLKDQLNSLTRNSILLKNEKDRLVSKISSKEEFASQHKATLDYSKLLQDKLLQIKLIKETVVSDLVFDDYLASSKKYKKYSLLSVIPFSIMLAFFFTLLIIIIRYSFDRRLMDEEEFKVIFKEIPFIGEIPELD